MKSKKGLGLLGGTFDPIHFGHLDAADAARTALQLESVLFIPAHDQPLRTNDPRCSDYQRFALISLALADRPHDCVSDMELVRQGRSYTEDTVRALHAQGWSASQLFFILGSDAFAEIARWRGFPSLLDQCHFAVIARPGTTIEEAIGLTPQLRPRVQLPDPNGLADDGATRVFLIPARTRDVSSTVIRARLAAGESIEDLVPANVARHIIRHHLYRGVGDLHDENERCES